MSQPTAVIDKSLFQEICQEDSAAKRQFYWDSLQDRYQLVIPFILIEEVLVNIIRPPERMRSKVLKRMAREVMRLEACWMGDLTECVFSELVEKRPAAKFRVPSSQVRD